MPLAYGMKQIRILLVDDHTLVRAGIRSLLDKQAEVEVVAEASNGREALDLVRLHQPDLVLMDIRMPEMDGLTASKKIRQLDNELRDIPIIALTANATKEDKEECIQAGMNDFIPKPINIDKLRISLQHVINQKS